MAQGPPALWPLAPLTRDGATGEAVQAVRDAIEGRAELHASRRADHLTVLWFIAEAEDVAVELLRVYIQKEKLMQSELYRSIFAEGKQEGRQEGRQEGEMEALLAYMTGKYPQELTTILLGAIVKPAEEATA